MMVNRDRQIDGEMLENVGRSLYTLKCWVFLELLQVLVYNVGTGLSLFEDLFTHNPSSSQLLQAKKTCLKGKLT